MRIWNGPRLISAVIGQTGRSSEHFVSGLFAAPGRARWSENREKWAIFGHVREYGEVPPGAEKGD
jgi:hypothetical protein